MERNSKNGKTRNSKKNKLNVTMEAFYGCSCEGCIYEGDEEKEFEVSDEVLAALKKINEKEVTSKDVKEAIENGQKILEGIHKEISDAVIKMMKHYWLFDVDSDCEIQSMYPSLVSDLEDGTFVPSLTAEEFEDEWEACESDEDREFLLEGIHYGDFGVYDWDDDSDEAKEERYHLHIMDEYHNWVYSNPDYDFIAIRVGCDFIFFDDEWSYTIKFGDK